jgi:hypothetical protein
VVRARDCRSLGRVFDPRSVLVLILLALLALFAIAWRSRLQLLTSGCQLICFKNARTIIVLNFLFFSYNTNRLVYT